MPGSEKKGITSSTKLYIAVSSGILFVYLDLRFLLQLQFMDPFLVVIDPSQQRKAISCGNINNNNYFFKCLKILKYLKDLST